MENSKKAKVDNIRDLNLYCQTSHNDQWTSKKNNQKQTNKQNQYYCLKRTQNLRWENQEAKILPK